MMPKVNIERVLAENEQKMIMQNASDRIDQDLKQSIQLEQGRTHKEMMLESLDEFG
jgi:hypothetical protein